MLHVSRCFSGHDMGELLTGDDGLHEEAEHGEHGQAAVLDLLHLQLSEGVGVVSQTQGVKGTTCSHTSALSTLRIPCVMLGAIQEN